MPVFINGMVIPYSEMKYTISYTFFVEEQQYIHQLKCTNMAYEYLTEKFGLIIAYDKIHDKSVIVGLSRNPNNQ